MDQSQQDKPPEKNKNPTELLFEQTQSLSELVEIQKVQKEQILELQHQNERVIGLLVDTLRESPEMGMTHVKIENINMPFGALVGFMVKISLASIPAFIILAIFYAIVIFMLSLFGIALGSLF